MRTLLIIILLLTAGCTTQPSMETGDGCWRFGVLESGNTGKLANLEDVEIVKLGYDEMLAACDTRDLIRGCYQPLEKKIYVYKGDIGQYVITHEQCHVILGTAHNNCAGYGIGKDESACNWKEL
jgi:hypothetical protein